MNNISELTLADCTGCEACTNICSINAIQMQADKKGFLYPAVDTARCISCGLCRKVCQIPDKDAAVTVTSSADIYYAVKNRNTAERSTSKSGGIFIQLADSISEQGGTVYGAALDTERKEVFHVRIEKREKLAVLKGSKYVQSRIGDVFQQVKEDLCSRKQVLFSGTACQCIGLLNYLKAKHCDTGLLYTVDLVCHGVPSPMVFQSYLEYLERKYKSPIERFDFRSKQSFGWGHEDERVIFKNGKTLTSKMHWNIDYYLTVYKHELIRGNCFSCAYARPERATDLTIGDFWGIDKVHPEFNDRKGISLLIIHTAKGKQLFEKNRTAFDVISVKREDCMQLNLIKPSERKTETDEYWSAFLQGSFSALARLDEPSLKQKVKIRLKEMLKYFKEEKDKKCENY